MAVSRSRRLTRVVVLTAATTAMSLLGGSPSWTEPIQPLANRTQPAPVQVVDGSTG